VDIPTVLQPYMGGLKAIEPAPWGIRAARSLSNLAPTNS